MKTVLSVPQVEFLQGQLLALEACLKPGEFDAQETLVRTRAILRVVKQTLEVALKGAYTNGFEFSMFD